LYIKCSIIVGGQDKTRERQDKVGEGREETEMVTDCFIEWKVLLYGNDTV